MISNNNSKTRWAWVTDDLLFVVPGMTFVRGARHDFRALFLKRHRNHAWHDESGMKYHDNELYQFEKTFKRSG